MPYQHIVELPDLPNGRVVPRDAFGESTSILPLRGRTILAVEDSRFASEALRLMCQRLGARLRRAETIQAARSHLRLYRPHVVIVDLGLPDGRGEALIHDLVTSDPHGPVVLGTSGDPAGRTIALAAGADGFLDKPLESFSAFQAILLRHLPDSITGLPPLPGAEDRLKPDHLALRDDLARAAALIEAGPTPETRAYLTSFLTGVARHAHDPDLAEAARSAGTGPVSGAPLTQLQALLTDRLELAETGFGTTPSKG